MTPAEADRQIAEMFHLWLLDIESVAYPVITVEKGQTPCPAVPSA